MLNLQINRGLDGKFRKPQQLLDGFLELYLHEMASQLVLYSPVDTGTYITGHHVGLDAVEPSRSSEGKDRNQDHSRFAQEAMNSLSAEIKQIPENSLRVVFSNDAYHWHKVEYEHAYAPYRKTANEHKRMAQKAEQTARARNR